MHWEPRGGFTNGKADGSLSIAHLLVELAQRRNGHALELALGVRKVDSPRNGTLLGRGHELRQVQRYTLVRCKGGWCRTSRLNRVLPDLPGELLRVSSSLEMHEGITWVANKDFSELELRTFKFQNLNL